MRSYTDVEWTEACGAIAEASAAVVVVDGDGAVVFLTAPAEAVWGVRLDELRGRPFPWLGVRAGASAASSPSGGLVAIGPDGTELGATLRLSPMPTPHGMFIAMIVGEGARSAAPPPGRADRGARPRVLVIDDDAMVAKTLCRLLGEEFECDTATEGRQAIAVVARGERYDAIVCDVSMPEVDGIAVYRELSAFAPAQAARMIFVTGGAYTTASQEFLARVDRPRVEKPFDTAQIRALVRRVASTRG
jgi:CheY-like chemotaxis protein